MRAIEFDARQIAVLDLGFGQPDGLVVFLPRGFGKRQVVARQRGGGEILPQLIKLCARLIEHLRFAGVELVCGQFSADLALPATLDQPVVSNGIGRLRGGIQVGARDVFEELVG